MEKLYFTFGSDPRYPYGRDAYVMTIGQDVQDCIAAYNKLYPPREPGSDIVNCADYYTQAQWDSVSKEYYKDVNPVKVIVSDALYGKKPEGFDPIWFWVPSQSTLIYLQEGSGDNLLPEDEKEGYIDYLDYTGFDLDTGDITEGDGGEMLMTEYVKDRYSCLADAIPDILDFEYDDMSLDAQLLKKADFLR